jgi:sigma-B regulation protein RsbU (phosphoserine phosphatase)
MGFYGFGEISPLVPGGASMSHGATLVTLLVGPQSDPNSLNRSDNDQTRQMPAAENLTSRNSFLQRKLQRSEAYRQRLESIKDFTSRMHRKIMDEIDEARQELQKKEAALSKSEEKYRRIVQTTGEGFILMDEDLKIIDANDAYCRMVGYPRSEVIGKSNVDLATEEFRQFLISNREELLAQEYRRFEGSLVARDGRHVPILVHGNTLTDDQGQVIGNMAFIADMTDQKKALALAGEVQRSLLPQESPRFPGLDVAGRNVSCDEVGGDYYDFFWQPGSSRSAFSVAVGDITGHGVDAALLMTSARAILRMHASQNESITQIVDAMNQHLSEDVMETGRFMTLFYLTIAPDLNSLQWVRAGHDPAIIYDPVTDNFEDLKGSGIALGIDKKYAYQPNHQKSLRDGQVIAIGTDGIWEACNRQNEMFGRDRFKALLRKYARYSAVDILNAIFAELDEFGKGRKSEDDITLVIIKIQKNR